MPTETLYYVCLSTAGRLLNGYMLDHDYRIRINICDPNWVIAVSADALARKDDRPSADRVIWRVKYPDKTILNQILLWFWNSN